MCKIWNKLKAILIGAGNRGETYTKIMLRQPGHFQVVAVAEPIDSRRRFNQRFLKGKMDVTLDTDLYNEVDDDYAIAMLFGRRERFNVKAVTAAPYFYDFGARLTPDPNIYYRASFNKWVESNHVKISFGYYFLRA